MNCRKAKKMIPLQAGQDLSLSRVSRLKTHLDKCPRCMREFEEYTAVLGNVKSLAKTEEVKDWSESEWKALVKEILSIPYPEKKTGSKKPSRLAWAYGFSLILLIIASGILLWQVLHKPEPSSSLPQKIFVEKTEIPEVKDREEGMPIKKEESPQPQAETRPRVMAKAKKPAGVAQPERPALTPSNQEKGQEVLSVTLVSQETGLKVVWFFNKNFEWKENGR